MLSFLKKIYIREIERYVIPPEDVATICDLLDLLNKGEQRNRIRLSLWIKIETIFPDLDFKHGKWSLSVENPLNVYISKKN